ncbi:MAG: diaminopimelate epimerase [Verrucomicrobiota bacterium]
MVLDFIKMSGAGNDFIIADNREQKFQFTSAQAVRICDRHRGVGADGLMLLIPCASGKADWSWDFFNSDGSRAEMCGNGARCFARYIQKRTGAADKITFETTAGIITAVFHGELVTINLTTPKDLRLNETVPLKGGATAIHSLNTGVPHAVVFVDDADKAMVQPTGAEVRYHAHFAPKGTNVNFVQRLGGNSIRVRTYERGVENETLACGTGVTASALIASRTLQLTSPIQVQVLGGDVLEVSFEEKNGGFENVRLTGPADFVFEGTIEI